MTASWLKEPDYHQMVIGNSLMWSPAQPDEFA
jgi:hypothetical protein